MKKFNQNNDFAAQVKLAKKTFPSHKKIRLRIKKRPVNPFGSPTMDKFIYTRNTYPEYDAYIHDNSISIYYIGTETPVVVRLPLDDKLWIELYRVFKLVPEKKD